MAPAVITRRDARLSTAPGKVHAVIGMRRVGKTTFLRQLQADLRQSLPSERAVFVSFDDDRLADIASDDLARLLEEYYRRVPELRGRERAYWFLDKIQLSLCPAGSDLHGGYSTPNCSRSWFLGHQHGCCRERSTLRCAGEAWRPPFRPSAFASSFAIVVRNCTRKRRDGPRRRDPGSSVDSASFWSKEVSRKRKGSPPRCTSRSTRRTRDAEQRLDQGWPRPCLQSWLAELLHADASEPSAKRRIPA